MRLTFTWQRAAAAVALLALSVGAMIGPGWLWLIWAVLIIYLVSSPRWRQ